MQNHTIPLVADGFPAFLYDTSIAVLNPKNRWAGYMRGPLLLCAFRTIYTSPSSATGSKPKKTKRGNAALLKLDMVTPEMIACAALQLRFALCSLQEYANVDGLFNFEDFYHFVLDSIYAGMSKGKWGDELFEWWNRQVFGNRLPDPDQPGPSYDDPFGGDPDAAPDSQDADADTDTGE
ncbi:hypothetical protein BT96DRAFT_1001737 [Gymnopus androsaceus JB14]|uniref:Uncharacterized protein n=1 Tax=Gymnopus androsaceus JB14 TaxID=1447944 RepID=A0A6A4GYT3_9AGAR|nr:hypothetical protein BT96DRAFT_1001737 [Gymnopus androsaceus JB14]